VSGNPPSRSQARQDVAGTLAACTSAGGGLGTDFDLAGGLQASDGGVDENDAEQGRLVAHSLRAEGFDASEDGSGRGTPLVTAFDTTQITHPENRCNPQPGDPCHPLAAGAHPPAVAFSIVPESGQGADLRASEIDIAPALTTEEAKMHDRGTRIASASAVRRLLPVECARLQGFPDDYLDLPGGADGAKYRALGNSMAVPVISWLGKRIGAVIEP
jgi:DNA (cytosine-5)-methyltransferase 1